MGKSLDTLPLEERLESYRVSSERALRQATETYDPAIRASLLTAAARWHALADDIEKVRNLLKETDAVHRPDNGGGTPSR